MPDDLKQPEPNGFVSVTENANENPIVPNPTTPPILAKKPRSKKLIFIIISLILLSMVAAVAYEYINAKKYIERLNKYQTTQEFSAYSKDLRVLLDDNNSRGAKTYTCQATLSMIWSPVSETPGSYAEPLDTQFFRSTNKIRDNWQKVESQLPAYKGFVFSAVLPQAETAKKRHNQTRELLTKTGLLMNMNDLTSYCPARVYESIFGFSYLEQFSKPDTIIMESPDILQQRLDYAKQAKQKLSEGSFPAEMGDVHQNLLSFYEKMTIDLTVLINARRANPKGVANMSSSFASNMNALEELVLNKASEVGKLIEPKPEELNILLRNATSP